MEYNSKNCANLQSNECQTKNKGVTLKYYFQTKETENRKTKLQSKSQVNLDSWVIGNDLSSDTPSASYWKVLAEKRRIISSLVFGEQASGHSSWLISRNEELRVALDDALKENERLWIIQETLTKENTHNRQLLEEANTFIDVFKDLLPDTDNDTGIDIGDVSLDSNINT